MKFSDAFKKKYFKAADLGGKVHRYTIKSVGMEEVGREQKPVLCFDGETRALVLNVTNATTLKDAWGEEMDDWVDNTVLLKPDKTNYEGKSVDCIRLAIPSKTKPTQVAQPKKKDESDDVPF